MAYQRTLKGTELITKGKAAELLGLKLGAFVYRVDMGSIPEGEIKSGRRKYYTEDQINKIKQQLNEVK